MSAATYNTAANAIWLQSTAPLWVLLFNLVIWHTGVGRRDLGALVLAAAGLGVILFYEFTHGSASPAESRWGVLCGLTAGRAAKRGLASAFTGSPLAGSTVR